MTWSAKVWACSKINMAITTLVKRRVERETSEGGKMARVQKSRGDLFGRVKPAVPSVGPPVSSSHPPLPFPSSLRAQGFTMQSSQTSQTSPKKPLSLQIFCRDVGGGAQTIWQERRCTKKRKKGRVASAPHDSAPSQGSLSGAKQPRTIGP